MKTLKLVFAFFLLITIHFTLHGQSLEKSLLWEVSGNGLESPSYLYGTLHMVCDEDFSMPDQLATVLKKSNHITFEIDMGAPDLMQQMQAAIMAETPLSTQLTKEESAKLDSLLQAKASMSLQMLDNFTLQAISSIMVQKSLPCNTPKSYESEILVLAQSEQKKVSGLETVAEQMDYMDKAFSDEFLLQQIFNFHMYENVMTEMTEAYKKQDVEKLFEFVTDERFSDVETQKWLLDERNKNWVKLMPRMMEKESNLFAVGSAHLAGEQGLIKLLRAQGYTVQPITR